MAKVAKELEIRGRQIYKPESRQCSGCGGAIELQDYYQWRKTVQHLSGAILRCLLGRRVHKSRMQAKR